MATKFITVKDTDGNWHSVNVKQITCVSWGEVPDSKPLDIIYLVDDHEIALTHKSESSYELAQEFDSLDLDEIIDIEIDEDEDTEEESDGGGE